MKLKLMIKTHIDTNMKYLCVTTKDDYENYSGSGVYWNNHLNKHGRNWKTKLLLETEDINLFNSECTRISEMYDVANNPDFANMIPEHGFSGNIFLVYEKKAKELGIDVGKHISNVRKKYFSLLTQEEKYEYTVVFRNGLEKFLVDKNSDKFIEWRKTLSKSQKNHWSKISDEKREEFGKKVSIGINSMSPEKKIKRAERLSQSFKVSEKRREYVDKMRTNCPNKGINNSFAKIIVWYGTRMTKGEFLKFQKNNGISEDEIIDALSNRADCYKEYTEKKIESGVCPHCKKENPMTSSFKRWHFDNCRGKNE